MKFVIAKPIKGHWHHYDTGYNWSVDVEEAVLFDEATEAYTHLQSLPDDEKIGAVILPAEIIVHYSTPITPSGGQPGTENEWR